MDPSVFEENLRRRLCELSVPEHIWDSLVAYIMDGRLVGNFLTAVLKNNFVEACLRADDINRCALFQIAAFLYEDAPAACHGSPQRVEAWLEQGGIGGKQQNPKE